ncbi:Ig-like domain-containing protein, partial [Vibrio paucivorans]
QGESRYTWEVVGTPISGSGLVDEIYDDFGRFEIMVPDGSAGRTLDVQVVGVSEEGIEQSGTSQVFEIIQDDIELVSVNVTPALLELETQEQGQLTAVATYSNGDEADITEDASWKSFNSDVAKVNKGLVTAISPGATDVRAKFGDLSSSAVIEVPEPFHCDNPITHNSQTFCQIEFDLSIHETPAEACAALGLSFGPAQTGTEDAGLKMKEAGWVEYSTNYWVTFGYVRIYSNGEFIVNEYDRETYEFINDFFKPPSFSKHAICKM